MEIPEAGADGAVPLSVIIHTRNEAPNIGCAVSNVRSWAQDVYVVDSGSQDDTQQLASAAGATVVSRPCDRSGLVAQRNWALDHLPISTEWVFVLDADETLDEQLKEEVSRKVGASPAKYDGFACRFKLMFLGGWVKRSSMYPTWSVRLFRQHIRYERREVNAHPRVAPGRLGKLDGHLLNDDQKGLSSYVKRLDEFSTLESIAYRKMGSTGDQDVILGRLWGDAVERRRYLKRVFVRLPARPVLLFVYLFVLKRGFMDGPMGLHYCIYKAVGEWLTGLKMREGGLGR